MRTNKARCSAGVGLAGASILSAFRTAARSPVRFIEPLLGKGQNVFERRLQRSDPVQPAVIQHTFEIFAGLRDIRLAGNPFLFPRMPSEGY